MPRRGGYRPGAGQKPNTPPFDRPQLPRPHGIDYVVAAVCLRITGLTCGQVADRLGVGKSWVSRYAGDVGPPQPTGRRPVAREWV